MLIVLFFVCQITSSIAEMNQQTNSVTFSSKPNLDLNDQEKISCIAQSGQTALYSVTIGTNVFRSNLVIYDAFKDAEIVLKPVDGSSVSDALTFFIGSYEIMFLDSTLIQNGAVGQLLSTMYNLNQCLYDGEISYETFQYIKPIAKVNPNCVVNPTNKVNLEFAVDGTKLLTQTIEKASFDFSKLVIDSIDCTTGTEEENKKCVESSKYISRNNFIYSEIKIIVPKTITSFNIYVDDYGKDQNVSTSYSFMLLLNLQITSRITSGDCTREDKMSFNQQSAFVTQTVNKNCDFTGYPVQKFWIIASELADNSGRKFQLQFYTTAPFNISQYVDCATWEISEYESMDQCNIALQNVSDFSSNLSSSIIYKLYSTDDDYLGSYIFHSANIPGGESNLIIFQNQLCVELLKNLTSERTFANVKVTLSSSFERYQNNQIDFKIDNNFIFPSPDQTYCFDLVGNQQNELNLIVFSSYFGTVETVDNLLHISEIQVYLEYDQFYQGYIFLIGMLTIVSIFIVIKSKCSRGNKYKPSISK